MKKFLIIFATLALVSGPALAQEALVGANAQQKANVTVTNTGPTYTTTTPKKTSVDFKNVPDVSAPGLTTTMTETCMGSTSGGVAWLGFGITGGTTWRDGRCANRLDARQWGNFGVQINDSRLVLVGVELLCEDKGNQRAAARAGVSCGPQDNDSPVVNEASPKPIYAPQVSTSGDLPDWFVSSD